jgi:hypothetical protein
MAVSTSLSFRDISFTREGSKGKVSKDYILLDNQSTHDTFYNPELLCNIKKAAGSVIVRANGGHIKYENTGVLPGYGTVWYNPDGIANILSLGRVENKGHLVEYSKGQFTITNKKSKNVTIFQKQGGLFVHRVNIAGGWYRLCANGRGKPGYIYSTSDFKGPSR